MDIRNIVEPLIGHNLRVTENAHSTKMSFTKPNEEYVVREILRLIGGGRHHSTMRMDQELFTITTDQKKALLRGIADVTGYIRKSNIAFGQDGAHRVYIEIPGNWYMVIDIANMLKEVDVPVQTIDFGHPNFRDGKLVKYNQGKPNFWKKEHQVKIFANEFLPIGFNIQHKQEALEKYSEELLEFIDPAKTHAEKIKQAVSPSDIGALSPNLSRNFSEQRKAYYSALSAQRSMREVFADGEKQFEMLKEDAFDGISDVYYDDRHTSGYDRLLSVLEKITNTTLTKSSLMNIAGLIGNLEKKGICHILVNDDKIKSWVNIDG